MKPRTTQPIMVITGPTACGKTETAIEIAKKLNAEIISADSMQIYKELNIGTGKPTIAEQGGIPHYLLDAVAPDYPFSVADFARLGHEAIEDIQQRGRLPIICGGTGFYINALIYNTHFTQTETDFDFRQKMADFAKENGADALHQKLEEVDRVAAQEIHPHNIKRVIRALEYFNQTGTKISDHNQREKERALFYPTVLVKVNMQRANLHQRIQDRADRMIKDGLEAEVRDLLSKYSPHITSMQGIGYKEMVAYIQKSLSLEAAIANIKTNTRRLGKRQISWSQHQLPPANTQGLSNWFTYIPKNNTDLLRDEIIAFYEEETKTWQGS